MAAISSLALFITWNFLLLLWPGSLVQGIPQSQTPILLDETTPADGSAVSGYWLASIPRQGKAVFGPSSYPVFRNVKDFGARGKPQDLLHVLSKYSGLKFKLPNHYVGLMIMHLGDGHTDDTRAINNAVSFGSRCGQGCDSSTTTPALVYFPPGTYVVSAPIIQLYYTQLVGDALQLPVLKPTASFQGIAVIDSDPYGPGGVNWYTNQNNFFRQIRNFVIDLTGMPPITGTGIHWQVAQATSLQNIRFEMIRGGDNNRQQGIFMDNGSGGFMTDLVFNGGNYGAFFGNQQFTSRNMTFNNCKTAIFMNWNWAWTLKSLNINNCGVGLDMSNGGPSQQSVGSVLILDSKITNTPKGIITAFGATSAPVSGGTLILDNVDFTGSSVAVASAGGSTILGGGSVVASWAQGNTYTPGRSPNSYVKARVQGAQPAPSKPAILLKGGAVFERSKPQYEELPVSSFVSVKSGGAKGDGVTDDTKAIQSILNQAKKDQVVYFDHGAYIVSDTIKVPKNIKITGEIWPLILASGKKFQDQSSPAPVFQVGQPGDSEGAVEMSDLIFETVGPQPGAILVEWNVAGGRQGAAGMWDVHFRIGGSAGTKLQSDTCTKNPDAFNPINSACLCTFMLLHITKKSTAYLENTWFWVADHELDRPDHNQISIFNGRGVLIESQGPVWLYGTSSEHHQLYNYQIANAKNIWIGLAQTETPYYQAHPNALEPFKPIDRYSDPIFADCATQNCRKAWGLRVLNSSDVFLYGAGFYSFFENYSQTCLTTESCQLNMVSVEKSQSTWLYGLSTKASTIMVSSNGAPVVLQADNRDNFCSTIALFRMA
jgi:glucan 1,3-beta-glucosidase